MLWCYLIPFLYLRNSAQAGWLLTYKNSRHLRAKIVYIILLEPMNPSPPKPYPWCHPFPCFLSAAIFQKSEPCRVDRISHSSPHVKPLAD